MLLGSGTGAVPNACVKSLRVAESPVAAPLRKMSLLICTSCWPGKVIVPALELPAKPCCTT